MDNAAAQICKRDIANITVSFRKKAFELDSVAIVGWYYSARRKVWEKNSITTIKVYYLYKLFCVLVCALLLIHWPLSVQL